MFKKICLALTLAFISLTAVSNPVVAAANPSYMPSVDSIATLKNLGLASSQYTTISVNGYYQGSTNGGGKFTWEVPSAGNSNCTPDGGLVLLANGVSGSIGCWVRVPSNMLSVFDFGAYGDDTHDDTAALQAWLTSLVGLGSVPTYHAGFICGTFKISSGLSLNFSATPLRQGPNISTCGSQKTAIDASSLSSGAVLSLTGNQGVVNTGRIEGIHFFGSSSSSSVTALLVTGAGSLRFQDWVIDSFGIGIQFTNASSSVFTEDNVCEHCSFVHTGQWIFYNQVSGGSSFKGDGCRDCFFAPESGQIGPFIVANQGSIVYQAPLDGHIIANGAGVVNMTIFSNVNTNQLSFFGNLNFEMSGSGQTVVMATGSADIFYAGHFLMFGAPALTTTAFTFGRFDLVNVYGGGNESEYQNQTCVGTVAVTAGSTVSVPVNCGAGLVAVNTVGAMTNVSLSIDNGWFYQSCYNVLYGNTGPTLSQLVACTPRLTDTGSFGAPTVSTSGRNLTFTNANWTGNLTYKITVVNLSGVFNH